MANEEKYVDPIVARLREIRLDEMGTKQSVAAREMGVGQGALSCYENGQTSPQLSFLRTWTKWSGTDLALIEVEFGTDVKSEPDGVEVRLTRYQAALAMGLLIAASRDESTSAQMGADLLAITDALHRAL